jgi:hypothetical protein
MIYANTSPDEYLALREQPEPPLRPAGAADPHRRQLSASERRQLDYVQVSQAPEAITMLISYSYLDLTTTYNATSTPSLATAGTETTLVSRSLGTHLVC